MTDQHGTSMTTSDPRQPADYGRVQRQLMGLLVVWAFLRGYQGCTFPVLARAAPGYMGFSSAGLGLLLACVSAGTFIGVSAVHFLLRQVPAGRALLGALVGTAACYLFLGLAPGAVLFGIGLVALGVFLGVVAITTPAFLVEAFPEARRRVLSLGIMAESLSGLVFPPLADALLWAIGPAATPRRFALAFRTPYVAVGALLVPVAARLRALSGAVPQQRSPADAVRLRGLLASPIAWLLVVMAVVHGSSDGTIYAWLPTVYAEGHKVMPLPPGTLLVGQSLAYIVGRLLLAALPEGFGRHLLLVLPGLLGGTTLLVCLGLDSPWALLVGYPLAAFLWCAEYPVLVAELAARFPGQFRSLLVAIFIAMPALAAGETWAVGQIRAHTGLGSWSLAPAVAGFPLFGLLGVAFWLLAARRPAGAPHSSRA